MGTRSEELLRRGEKLEERERLWLKVEVRAEERPRQRTVDFCTFRAARHSLSASAAAKLVIAIREASRAPRMSSETTDDLDMNLVAGLYDVPAYVRRARNVEQALAHLLARANVQRHEWLEMVRLRVGMLRALAGDWSALRPLLANDEQVALLRSIHDELSPSLRLPPEPTRSTRVLRRALAELVESLERFNARWEEYRRKIDLTHVNELRVGYNRYYLIEKSCASKSDAVARAGYSPLPMLDLAELERHLPLLPVPLVVS